MLKFYIKVLKSLCLQNASMDFIDSWPNFRHCFKVLFSTNPTCTIGGFEVNVMDLEFFHTLNVDFYFKFLKTYVS